MFKAYLFIIESYDLDCFRCCCFFPHLNENVNRHELEMG